MKRYTLLIGSFVLVVGLLGVAASQVGSSFTHPRNRNVKLVIVDNQGAILTSHDQQKPQGKIAVENSAAFDFGHMDPHGESEHTFVLKNTGSGPVELENLGTSCKKCTIAKISKPVLAPGEEVEVLIHWNCGSGPLYMQTATIGTKNNIAGSSIQLKVEGRVRMNLASQPEEIVLEGISPAKPTEGRAVFYSQRFENAEILECKSSREDFMVTLEDVPASDLEASKLSWAKEVRVHLPANLPSGPFEETVFLKLRAPNAEREMQEYTYNLRLKGKVKKGLTVVGRDLDERGIVEFGFVERGIEHQRKYKLKIQDTVDFDLRLQEISLTPDFVKVTVVPTPGVDSVKGLYDLTITIPADAPVCNFMTDQNLGQVRLISDHPRVKEFPLALRFAVREE